VIYKTGCALPQHFLVWSRCGWGGGGRWKQDGALPWRQPATVAACGTEREVP